MEERQVRQDREQERLNSEQERQGSVEERQVRQDSEQERLNSEQERQDSV